MASDKVLKYFYKLRSEILKKGSIKTTTSMTLSGNPMALMQQYKAPPGTKAFFMGDNIGGCGWEVEVEPGVTEKFYVDVPDNIPGLEMTINVHLLDAPKDLKGRSVLELGNHYFSYLAALVKEAKMKFVTSRYTGLPKKQSPK